MSRIWKKKDRIFVFDQNTLILNNKIEELLYKLKMSCKLSEELPNIVDYYIEKQKEIISYLDKYNIDYYSEDFTLNRIILNKLEIEIDACERELIKAINKTKHSIYKTFAKTNFNKYIIGNNINNYYRFLNNIKQYDFAKDLDNIIKYKYSNKTNYYLSDTIKKDKKVLDKLGRKDLVKYINDIVKR